MMSPAVSHSLARQVEGVLLGLLFLLLAWAPIPLASNRAWSGALLAMAAWALLTLTLCWQWLGRNRTQPASRRSARSNRVTVLMDEAPSPSPAGRWWVTGLLLAFVAWAARPLWQPGAFAWVSAHDTQVFLVRWLAAVAVFGLVIRLVTSPRRRMLLMLAVLGSAVLQALLAILLFSANGRHEIFGYSTPHALRATGTFANADHLAFFLVMGLCMGIGVMLAQMGQGRPQGNLRDKALQLLQFFMSTKMLVRMLLVVLVIALVLTRSRAGNGVFFIALLGLALWVMVRSPRLRLPAAVLVCSLLVVDVIVVGQWVGLDKVVQRLQATELTNEARSQKAQDASAALATRYREETIEQRLAAARAAWPLVGQAPLNGHGAGTFYLAFAPHQTEQVVLGRFDHAHNDYIELLVDTGWVGWALWTLFCGATLWRALRLMGDAPHPTDRGVLAGAGMALSCAAMHSVVDFNLQITANLVMLILIIASVWTVPSPVARPVKKS